MFNSQFCLRMEFLVKGWAEELKFSRETINWMFPFHLTKSLKLFRLAHPILAPPWPSADLHRLWWPLRRPLTALPSLWFDGFAGPKFSASAFWGAASWSKNQVQGPSHWAVTSLTRLWCRGPMLPPSAPQHSYSCSMVSKLYHSCACVFAPAVFMAWNIFPLYCSASPILNSGKCCSRTQRGHLVLISPLMPMRSLALNKLVNFSES